MKRFFSLLVCLLVGVSAVQAKSWLRILRKPGVPKVSYSQQREIVKAMTGKVEREIALNRINLPAAQLPRLQKSFRSYHKTVAVHFPEVAVKPVASAANTLEDMALTLPASLKEENVFVQTIPAILQPTEAYVAAMFADSWATWLESGIAPRPPAEMVVPRADVKRARALQQDLEANFAKIYAALPAEEKDLSAQLSRVIAYIRQETGMPEAQVVELEVYFSGVLRPMIARQENLTSLQFLQAYDVLAVAAELPGRYVNRVKKGSSTLLPFLLNESIRKVMSRLPERFAAPAGSARYQRLQKWYSALYSSPKPTAE